MAGESVAASSSGGLPRPVLKGLHHATVKKNLYIAIGLSIGAAIAYKFVINDPRKKNYAEFYKNYDQNAAFQRMRKAGLFVSAPADD